MSLTLVLTFESEADPVAPCEALLSMAASMGAPETSFQLTNRAAPVPRAKIGAVLEVREDRFFSLHGDKVVIRFGPNRGAQGVFLSFDLAALAPSIASLDSWLARLGTDTGVVYARLMDPEYDQWQNEIFVSKFELIGKSTAKLKTVRDPVLGRELVDTSANPGRSVARTGYVEALGHEMWLMPLFWQLTKAKPDLVERTFRCRVLGGSTWGVTVSEAPLGEDNPPSEHARRILFP